MRSSHLLDRDARRHDRGDGLVDDREVRGHGSEDVLREGGLDRGVLCHGLLGALRALQLPRGLHLS